MKRYMVRNGMTAVVHCTMCDVGEAEQPSMEIDPLDAGPRRCADRPGVLLHHVGMIVAWAGTKSLQKEVAPASSLAC